jgi:Flp pilus assembly protein TadB
MEAAKATLRIVSLFGIAGWMLTRQGKEKRYEQRVVRFETREEIEALFENSRELQAEERARIEGLFHDSRERQAGIREEMEMRSALIARPTLGYNHRS